MVPDDEALTVIRWIKRELFYIFHLCLICKRLVFFNPLYECDQCMPGPTTSPDVEPTESDARDL